jgi:FixJ family two-component response regulator
MTLREEPNESATPASTTDVYLVDDDPLVRRSLTRLLESAGYKVESFAEPNRFLQRFLGHPAPIVILDIWIENATGMELLADIYARSPATRLIFITGRHDHARETTVKQAGAFAFLNKPLDPKLFLDAVQSVFEAPSS